jgi:hypothetical protein
MTAFLHAGTAHHVVARRYAQLLSNQDLNFSLEKKPKICPRVRDLFLGKILKTFFPNFKCGCSVNSGPDCSCGVGRALPRSAVLFASRSLPTAHHPVGSPATIDKHGGLELVPSGYRVSVPRQEAGHIGSYTRTA